MIFEFDTLYNQINFELNLQIIEHYKEVDFKLYQSFIEMMAIPDLSYYCL